MTPVIVRINRRRCVLLGSLYAAMTVLFLPAVTVPLFYGIFDGIIAAGLGIAAFFGWFALYFFSIARKNPVALRMDAQGISGYYANPATWPEIKKVFAFTGSKSHRFLGFELHDPIAFRSRQSPWRRYLSWSHGRTHGAHLVLPQMILEGTDVETLAAQAQTLLHRHASARTRRVTHNHVT